jgi:hypothetical protein
VQGANRTEREADKSPYVETMPDESRLQSSLLSSGILYIQRVTIPDAVIIQFVLLKMGMLMLKTCQGL